MDDNSIRLSMDSWHLRLFRISQFHNDLQINQIRLFVMIITAIIVIIIITATERDFILFFCCWLLQFLAWFPGFDSPFLKLGFWLVTTRLLVSLTATATATATAATKIQIELNSISLPRRSQRNRIKNLPQEKNPNWIKYENKSN